MDLPYFLKQTSMNVIMSITPFLSIIDQTLKLLKDILKMATLGLRKLLTKRQLFEPHIVKLELINS